MKICYRGILKVDYKIIDKNELFVIPAGTNCIITEEHSVYEDTFLGEIVQSEFTRALIHKDFFEINNHQFAKKIFYKTFIVRREDIQKIEELNKA